MINESVTDLDKNEIDGKGLLTSDALQEVVIEDLSERVNSEKKRRKKKCQCCYSLSDYGCCPFQLELTNFVEFNGESTFMNSRMIVVSTIAMIIIFGFYVNLTLKFGKIDQKNREIKSILSDPLDEFNLEIPKVTFIKDHEPY